MPHGGRWLSEKNLLHVKLGTYYGGGALTVYGTWLAWHPLGFVVGGLALVWVSLVIDKQLANSEKEREDGIEN